MKVNTYVFAACCAVYIVAYIATRGTILYFNKIAGLLALPVFIAIFAISGRETFNFDIQNLRQYFVIYGIACLLLGAWAARSDNSPWGGRDVLISVGCNVALLSIAIAGTIGFLD